MVGASLLVIALARLSGYEPVSAEPAPVVESRDLHFADRADGAVDVIENGQPVALLASGTDGFVRVVLRSFTRDRRLHGIGREEPFRLRVHANGRLSIEDRATLRVVDLSGFGADNIAAFSRLITKREANR
jgi:putative photosynthetic complex assembly protein